MDGLYSHSAYLLQELQDQRIQGLLCDCTLVVKGVCFKAHKNVLAAFSSYFRSLFQNSLKTDVFHLAIQDVGGIGQVLDYMYTSRLELNQDNTHTLLHIAKCLQVSNILNMCSAYLKPCTVSGETGLSVPALPSHEQDCVLGVPSPAEQDLISTHTDLPKHLLLPHDPDPIHCKRPQPALLPSTLETANNMSALSERQPAHGYKLRNFYSKQYFKQTAVQNGTSRQSHVHCPPVVEEQYNIGSSSQTLQNADANTANQTLQNTSTANSQSLPAVPSSSANQLLPHISSHSGRSVLTQPVECVTAQTSASCASVRCPDHLSAVLPPAFSSQPVGGRQSPPAPRALRHKKALYLKKYLRSQPMLEEGVEQSTEMESCSTERVQQVEPQSQPAQISINTPPEDRQAESGEGAELPVPPRAPSPSPPLAPSPPHPLAPSPPPSQPETSTGPAGRLRLTNSSNKYCCEMCGKTFKHPSNLELHKRSHTGEKPFQCIVCGKNFSQAGNLQTHLRRHSGEKPYICELCGKSFAASGDVQRHIIIHSGARPHLCDICGRGFSNFSNLKEHKRTHSLEREFTCEQCGKSFNMQRKLIKHTLTHTGERRYCCHTCGKSFAGSGDLHRHMRSHTGERPYVCSACGKGFTRMAVLRRHRTSTCKPSPPAPPPSSGQGADLCPLLRPASTPHPAGVCLRVSPNPAPSSSAPHAHKASLSPVKPRPHAEPPFSSCCEENGASALADSAVAQLAPAGPSSSGSQPHDAPYRSSEGFCSSGTLWVLDEKDLPE